MPPPDDQIQICDKPRRSIKHIPTAKNLKAQEQTPLSHHERGASQRSPEDRQQSGVCPGRRGAPLPNPTHTQPFQSFQILVQTQPIVAAR